MNSLSYSPKRCLFFSHQSALISSDNWQAAFSVSLLRRAILSMRSQLTKSLTWSTDIILKKYREERRRASFEL